MQSPWVSLLPKRRVPFGSTMFFDLIVMTYWLGVGLKPSELAGVDQPKKPTMS